MRHVCYGAPAAVKPSFFGVYYGLSARRAGRVGCVAALRAASEVKRSGTERLSGFRRAERATNRGERVCADVF